MSTRRTNKEDMQNMVREMMEKMLSNMTSDDKIEMMMGKIKEGINMEEMMPKIMMAMMSAEKGTGGMKEMMAKMMKSGEEQESMMPEIMLKGMMPAIANDKPADLVSSMLSTPMAQASSGMSDEEKAVFVAKVSENIKT